MAYVKKMVDYLNGEIAVVKMQAPMFGNHIKRNSKLSRSSAIVKKCNQRHKIDYVEAKLQVNFMPMDWHIALTYPASSIVDEPRAQKDRRNFFERLKRRCQKRGIKYKYLTMTEIGIRSKQYHHHVVISHSVPLDIIYQCWTEGQVRILSVLRPDREWRGLAEYYVDKTKQGRKDDDRSPCQYSYSFSRNCIAPKITYEIISSHTWRSQPKPPKGYAVKPGSLYECIDSFSGYPYQRYVITRLNQ